MPRKHYKPEQIISILRQIEVEQANGKTMSEACRNAEITDNTFYRWKKQYGGMKIDDAKRLKDLEKENNQLKKLVADQALDIQILKEVSKGKF